MTEMLLACCDASTDGAVLVYRGAALSRVIQRAQAFGVSAQVCRRCRTMGDLKRLVRKSYLRMAWTQHPDHLQAHVLRLRHGSIETRFKLLGQRYAWFQAQPDTGKLPGAFQTIPDIPVPDNYDPFHRELSLPWGFQEDRAWVSWQ